MVDIKATIDSGFSTATMTFVASRNGVSLGTAAATVTQIASLVSLASASIDMSSYGAGVVDLVLVVNDNGVLVWDASITIDADGNAVDPLATRLLNGDSPVITSGRINPLIIGDDYKATNGRALSWTITSTVTVASCRLAIYQSATRQMVITGTPTNGTGTVTLSFDIDKADWSPMTNGDAEFNVEMRDGAGNEITPVHSFIASRKVKLIHKYT